MDLLFAVIWYQRCKCYFPKDGILARLYIILYEKNEQENSLIEFLKPDIFDLLLWCLKKLRGVSY